MADFYLVPQSMVYVIINLNHEYNQGGFKSWSPK